MYAALLTLVLCAAPQDVPAAPDTLVVGPREFLPALQPWLAHRAAQGHRFAYVPNTLSAEQIRAVIRETAQAGKLRHVVLLGDAEPGAATDAVLRARSTPTYHVQAKVNIRWGAEPEIATDNWYADLTDNQVPDLAIGRLTADSPEELALMVRKILAYESAPAQGAWPQRLNFIAGAGGFGPVVDSVLEMATKKFLTDGIPAAYATSMTYGSWRSPFCPDPRRFHEAAVERLNEGCLFWVYLGHGHPTALEPIRVPGGAYPVLNTRDMDRLRSRQSLPIAILLACYTGAFDQPQDCLAEELLRAEGGPVAVLSGSRVTMPYGMAVLGNALMDEYFQHRRPTLGEVVLHAKQRMITPDPDNPQRQLLDAIASVLSPVAEQLLEERLEHLQLFNLLGDPLLRLPHPDLLELTLPETITAGQQVVISGTSPLAGRGTIELVCRRDRMKTTPPTRHQFDHSSDALTQFQGIYHQANDHRWSVDHFALEGGEFRTTVQVPEDARGPSHVRLFVHGEQDYALGAATVFVRPAGG